MTETGEEDNFAGETALPNPGGGRPDDPRRTFLREWLAANEPGLRTALRPIAAPAAGADDGSDDLASFGDA